MQPSARRVPMVPGLRPARPAVDYISQAAPRGRRGRGVRATATPGPGCTAGRDGRVGRATGGRAGSTA